MTDAELIRMLRCSASVHTEKINCEGCPVFVKEEVPEELQGQLPVDFCYFCYSEPVMLLAADRLEELTKEPKKERRGHSGDRTEMDGDDLESIRKTIIENDAALKSRDKGRGIDDD